MMRALQGNFVTENESMAERFMQNPYKNHLGAEVLKRVGTYADLR